MKRIAFVVSWFYKTFTPTTILVTLFHICTCDDVTLVNEKSIVSWKYMKSNKKCVFNVNFQRKLYVSFIICLFFRPISALIIPTPLLFVLFVYILVKWSVIVIILNTCLNSDFDFCNLSSSGDVVYKERWWHWPKLVTDLLYDFVSILLLTKFKMQSNWKISVI
jgi:hypothetical protein